MITPTKTSTETVHPNLLIKLSQRKKQKERKKERLKQINKDIVKKERPLNE